MAARAVTPPKKPQDTPATAPQQSVEERIRQRAHEIYLQRGGQHGSDVDDWLKAEQEIRGAEDQKIIARAEGEGMVRRG